jgi:hypothetical protein
MAKAWSERVRRREAYRRTEGRHARRRFLASLRRRKVVQLLPYPVYLLEKGVQAMLAAQLGAHRSKISRDVAILLGVRHKFTRRA